MANPTKEQHRVSFGDLPQDLLARASAQNFRQLGRVDLLEGLHDHPDPVVREHSAYAGANPSHLCAGLNDPWPQVQYASIRGLEKLSSPQALCLSKLLSSSNHSLRLRSIRALGHLASAKWASGHSAPPQLSQKLRETTQSVTVSSKERKAALTTLALWGHFEPARRVLEAHLESGGLVEFTRGALQALVVGRAPNIASQIRLILKLDIATEIKLDALNSLADPRAHWESHRPPFTIEQRIQTVLELNQAGPYPKLFQNAIEDVLSRLRPRNNLKDDIELPPIDKEDEG